MNNKTKKFKLTNITKNHFGYKLYQIVALKEIDILSNENIEVGELGGWVEDIGCLSQEGISWIDKDSMVYGNSKVLGNSVVFNSIIRKGSLVDGNSTVSNSRISGVSLITNSIVEDSNVFKSSTVEDLSSIRDSLVTGNSIVRKSSISESSVIQKGSLVKNSRVCNAKVTKNTIVIDDGIHITITDEFMECDRVKKTFSDWRMWLKDNKEPLNASVKKKRNTIKAGLLLSEVR